MEYFEQIKDKEFNVSPLQRMAGQQPPNWAWDSAKVAWRWICKKYGLSSATRVPPLRGSYACRFSKFSWGSARHFCGRPHIRMQLKRSGWTSYRRKSIGVYAKRIKMPKETLMQIQMVHEFTHYVQHIQGRQYSEVETTKNEIEFVKEDYPQYIKELKPIN